MLKEKHGIEVIVPNHDQILFIHHIIHDEIALGKLSLSSKEKLKELIEELAKNGAEGVILGCTELPLLLKQDEVNVPLFDTLTLHAIAAVDYALKK